MSEQYDGNMMAQTIIRLRDQVAKLKAERDRAHRACEQISVRLHAAQTERDAYKADAERYRWLRTNCYKQKWPNNEYDSAMHLSFTVSGIWSDNLDPAVLDGCIDAARGEA